RGVRGRLYTSDMLRIVSWILVLLVWLSVGCSAQDEATSAADAVVAASPDVPAVDASAGVDVSDTAAVECSVDEDCALDGGCVASFACVDGACSRTVIAPGTACSIGCEDGVCTADGQCGERVPKACVEKDGNTCTIPTCIVTPGAGVEDSPGACTERVIEDGEPPYAGSECFDGAVCLSGQVDNADALPTALAIECDGMGADLDPLGCVDHFVCVGGDEKCRPVVKPDGTQCWEDQAGPATATCAGLACTEGSCVASPEFTASCGDGDYPAGCEAGCQGCTALSCHWIDDPAAVGQASKRVRYCQPAAVAAECDSDPCRTGEQCGFGAQADGPLGKETLGVCGGGVPKTAEQCLDEAGKPALSCLVAGTSCDAAEGGCVFAQDVMDSWCWPPLGLCWEQDETYCTHLDAGPQWDGETGCNTAWVDLDCDDGNVCTVGQCKPQLSDFACDYTLLSGSVCDDGDACTEGESCVVGECAGSTSKCDDGDACNGTETCDVGGACGEGTQPDCDDGNDCTTDSCDPQVGCLHAATNGVACEDGDPCTWGSQCLGAVCQPGPKALCDDGNICNGVETCYGAGTCDAGTPLTCIDGNECTDDVCDPVTGCSNPDNDLACDDGDPCILESLCIGGACVMSVINSCNDGDDCTEDQCDSFTVNGCINPVVPVNTPCPGGVCIKGECTCTAVCAPGTCGNDGCGGTCTCDDGVSCVGGVCGGGDLDGQYWVTADPDTQTIGGILPATWVPFFLDMVFTETTAAASAAVQGIPINYTGVRNGDNFSLAATWIYAGSFSDEVHDETWNCVLTGPTTFDCAMVDLIDTGILGTLSASWNVTGTKL
ncbi:MAG: hypothetical protein ACI9WU_005030, partial [Myxococcota bacterium]